MDTIRHYYPNLTAEQTEQFTALGALYADWNAKINVISRKDIDNLYVHHILHSLAVEKMIHFRDDTIVMDAGTGGGFPGIPLAILFPKVSFHLIDSIGKKVKVAQVIADSVGLRNVTTRHGRLEEEKTKYDFIVSRAVMSLSDLAGCVRKNIRSEHHNALPNGLICLKGGELQHELAPFRQRAVTLDLETYYNEPFFKKKKVIYIQL